MYATQRRVYDPGKHRDTAVIRGRVEKYEGAATRGLFCTHIRKSVVDEIGGFEESIPAREDADFWIRLFLAFYMVGLDRVWCTNAVITRSNSPKIPDTRPYQRTSELTSTTYDRRTPS